MILHPDKSSFYCKVVFHFNFCLFKVELYKSIWCHQHLRIYIHTHIYSLYSRKHLFLDLKFVFGALPPSKYTTHMHIYAQILGTLSNQPSDVSTSDVKVKTADLVTTQLLNHECIQRVQFFLCAPCDLVKTWLYVPHSTWMWLKALVILILHSITGD